MTHPAPKKSPKIINKDHSESEWYCAPGDRIYLKVSREDEARVEHLGARKTYLGGYDLGDTTAISHHYQWYIGPTHNREDFAEWLP